MVGSAALTQPEHWYVHPHITFCKAPVPFYHCFSMDSPTQISSSAPSSAFALTIRGRRKTL